MKHNTLYISDLDGTLLDNDAHLSDTSREILTRLLLDGLAFTVASARSITTIRSVLADLPLNLPVIEFNGAFLTDFNTGSHLLIRSIETRIVSEIHRRIVARGHAPFVSTYDGIRDRLYYDRILTPAMQWYVEDRIKYGDPRLTHVAQTRDKLSDQVVCLTVLGEKEPLEELLADLQQAAGHSVELHLLPQPYTQWFSVTAHDRRATKDQAISSLKDMCGLHDHEIVVFGDQLNDLKMFKAAQRGIAVENANPALLATASRVIGPNTSDSVAQFIQMECRDRE